MNLEGAEIEVAAADEKRDRAGAAAQAGRFDIQEYGGPEFPEVPEVPAFGAHSTSTGERSVSSQFADAQIRRTSDPIRSGG